VEPAEQIRALVAGLGPAQQVQEVVDIRIKIMG